MAYKRRKEIVESQIKEHNLSKVKAQSEAKSLKKCPMSIDSTEDETPKSNETIPSTNEPKNTDGKKIVVSIQSNEEKTKENTMSNLT